MKDASRFEIGVEIYRDEATRGPKDQPASGLYLDRKTYTVENIPAVLSAVQGEDPVEVKPAIHPGVTPVAIGIYTCELNTPQEDITTVMSRSSRVYTTPGAERG